MSFQSRIVDLAGEIPGTADGEQFCNDGVRDVVSRVIRFIPGELRRFAQSKNTAPPSAVIAANGYPVIAAWTASSVTGASYPATRVSREQFVNAGRTGSIHLATAYSPVYTHDPSGVMFLPSGATYTHYIRQVVANTVTDWTGTSSIASFPLSWYDAVVVYAAIQVLHHKLVVKTLPTDLSLPVAPSTVSISTTSESLPTFSSPPGIVLPDTPADADIDFSSVPSAPSYTAQMLALTISEPTTLTWRFPSVPVVPSLSTTTVDTSSLTAPTFVAPSVSIDYTQLETFLHTDEDSELAAGELQNLSTKLAEVQANLQNAINSFNMGATEYQALLQVAIQNAQLAGSDDAKELQRYSGEVQAYTAEVTRIVQENQAIMSAWGTEWSLKSQSALGEYSADIQNESARVQLDLGIYQQAINKALSQYQAETGYDIAKYRAAVEAEIQRYGQALSETNASFQSGMSKYTAEVQQVASANQSTLAEHQGRAAVYSTQLNGELQDFGARVQKAGLEYQWMQDQYQRLKKQYDEMFVVPKEG